MNILNFFKSLIDNTETTSYEEVCFALQERVKQPFVINGKQEHIKILKIENLISNFSVHFVVKNENPNVIYGPENQITYIGSGRFPSEYIIQMFRERSLKENIQIFENFCKNLYEIFPNN